jgi:putative ABC transport system ATP-binding protein
VALSVVESEFRSLYVEPEAVEAPVGWPALQLNDVFRIFRSGPVETVALRGLELRVDPGEFVAVLGPSGCGKSTMLALAAALDNPSAGEVRAAELSLGLLDEAALADYRARRIGLVLQRDNLWPTLTAGENVSVSLRLAGRAGVRDAAKAALDAFGLLDRIDQRAGSLSGGEHQRVAIAAAAARQAPLVLADEPTGELDATNEQRVLQALRELRDSFGSTVVAVTHSPRVAQAADRVIHMSDGRALV